MNRYEEMTAILMECLGGISFGVWQESWAAGAWMLALITLSQYACKRVIAALRHDKEESCSSV